MSETNIWIDKLDNSYVGEKELKFTLKWLNNPNDSIIMELLNKGDFNLLFARWNIDSVTTTMPSMNCLTSVLLYSGINFLNKFNTIYSNMFQGNKSLREINISTKEHEIAPYAFDNCVNLKKVTMSGISHIRVRAFSGCISLKEITIPAGIEYLGEAAFEDCTNLEKVYLPKTIKHIDSRCFETITSPRTSTLYIFYDGNLEDWKKINFLEDDWYYRSIIYPLKVVFKDKTVYTPPIRW